MATQEEQEVNELKRLFEEKKISVDEYKKRLVEIRLRYRKQPRSSKTEEEEERNGETEAEQQEEEEEDFYIVGLDEE